ncbi:hypothetical protein [Candidatus Nitrosotenuis cloacae]|uniref:hypothetical protein n=1 Tax=Candidatus Nitrosotenuis cloacae TaxID=1603555 RepID=UPI00227EB63A|nr:hypothetical protein [Candidatus Nitrosotenuis cloacae]
MSDNLWLLTVVAALSSLLILAFFTLSPILDDSGTVERTRTGIDKAVQRFDELKETPITKKQDPSAPDT